MKERLLALLPFFKQNAWKLLFTVAFFFLGIFLFFTHVGTPTLGPWLKYEMIGSFKERVFGFNQGTCIAGIALFYALCSSTSAMFSFSSVIIFLCLTFFYVLALILFLKRQPDFPLFWFVLVNAGVAMLLFFGGTAYGGPGTAYYYVSLAMILLAALYHKFLSNKKFFGNVYTISVFALFPFFFFASFLSFIYLGYRLLRRIQNKEPFLCQPLILIVILLGRLALVALSVVVYKNSGNALSFSFSEFAQVFLSFFVPQAFGAPTEYVLLRHNVATPLVLTRLFKAGYYAFAGLMLVLAAFFIVRAIYKKKYFTSIPALASTAIIIGAIYYAFTHSLGLFVMQDGVANLSIVFIVVLMAIEAKTFVWESPKVSKKINVLRQGTTIAAMLLACAMASLFGFYSQAHAWDLKTSEVNTALTVGKAEDIALDSHGLSILGINQKDTFTYGAYCRDTLTGPYAGKKITSNFFTTGFYRGTNGRNPAKEDPSQAFWAERDMKVLLRSDVDGELYFKWYLIDAQLDGNMTVYINGEFIQTVHCDANFMELTLDDFKAETMYYCEFIYDRPYKDSVDQRDLGFVVVNLRLQAATPKTEDA